MARPIDIFIAKEELEYKYHNENKTLEQIGKEIGISTSTVSRWVRKYNIKKKEHDIDAIINDYIKNNLTALEIYKKYHISKPGLKELLISKNIHIKTRSDYYIDLSNKQFGFLRVIRISEKEYKDSSKRWVCECTCGRIKTIKSSSLVSGVTKSCGNKRVHEIGELSNKWTGYKEISGVRWNSIKNGALRRKLDFEITIEYIWDLFIEQDRKCALTGLDLWMSIGDPKNRIKHGNASIDRIDPTKGYIEGNIQWVLWDVNKMKQDFSEEKLFYLCEKILYYKEIRNEKVSQRN